MPETKKEETTNTMESKETKSEPIILGSSSLKEEETPAPSSVPETKEEETPAPKVEETLASVEETDEEGAKPKTVTAFIAGVIIGAILTSLFI